MSRLVLLFWTLEFFAQQVKNPHSSAEDVAQGEKTFRSHCSPCHGLKGDGGRGPNLSNGVFYHGSTDAELLTNISDGIAGTEMPGLFYSSDRVWQVVAYIRSLNSASERRSQRGVEQGSMLFKNQGCGRCHRIKGHGGRMGPDLSEIGKTRAREHLRQAIVEPDADVRPRYWVVILTGADGKKYEGFLMNEDTYTVQFIDMSEQLHSMQKSELTSYRIDKISKMPSYGGKLTGEQVSQLVDYLSSLRPAKESR
ncbi:MAG: putative heme-binding protein [Bryobacterales bacterium]|nr:putative heme-binding protein [Bryobacterales bacterium]